MRDDVHCYQASLDRPPCIAAAVGHQHTRYPSTSILAGSQRLRKPNFLVTNALTSALKLQVPQPTECSAISEPLATAAMPRTCCVEVLAVILAAAACAVVPKHERDGQKHKEESKSDHDAVACSLVQQHSSNVAAKVGCLRMQTRLRPFRIPPSSRPLTQPKKPCSSELFCISRSMTA